MNVGELKAALEDYNDHAPVVLVVEAGPTEYVYTDPEVGDRSINGEFTVDLTVSE